MKFAVTGGARRPISGSRMVQESVWWTRIESPEAVERAAKKKRTESAGTDLDAVEFARARLGFQPDELQATVLRSTAASGDSELLRGSGASRR